MQTKKSSKEILSSDPSLYNKNRRIITILRRSKCLSASKATGCHLTWSMLHQPRETTKLTSQILRKIYQTIHKSRTSTSRTPIFLKALAIQFITKKWTIQSTQAVESSDIPLSPESCVRSRSTWHSLARKWQAVEWSQLVSSKAMSNKVIVQHFWWTLNIITLLDSLTPSLPQRL